MSTGYSCSLDTDCQPYDLYDGVCNLETHACDCVYGRFGDQCEFTFYDSNPMLFKAGQYIIAASRISKIPVVLIMFFYIWYWKTERSRYTWGVMVNMLIHGLVGGACYLADAFVSGRRVMSIRGGRAFFMLDDIFGVLMFLTLALQWMSIVYRWSLIYSSTPPTPMRTWFTMGAVATLVLAGSMAVALTFRQGVVVYGLAALVYLACVFAVLIRQGIRFQKRLTGLPRGTNKRIHTIVLGCSICGYSICGMLIALMVCFVLRLDAVVFIAIHVIMRLVMDILNWTVLIALWPPRPTNNGPEVYSLDDVTLTASNCPLPTPVATSTA